MGTFWSRLFECPLKDKPICFHLQKNFTTTGEEKPEEEPQTDAYDDLQTAFIVKLAEVRDENKNWMSDNFPFWDELASDALHNTYMLFASKANGLMDFRHLYCQGLFLHPLNVVSSCWFLDSVGDSSSVNYREEKFKETDVNNDGFINIDEFLLLVYFYQPFNEINGLEGVAKACMEAAEYIRTLNKLSVGEQLQYGLF